MLGWSAIRRARLARISGARRNSPGSFGFHLDAQPSMKARSDSAETSLRPPTLCLSVLTSFEAICPLEISLYIDDLPIPDTWTACGTRNHSGVAVAAPRSSCFDAVSIAD